MNIRYFAWLREQLNIDHETVDPPATVNTIGGLIDWLADRDEAHALAFQKRHLIRAAVDDEMVDHDASIANVGTVALFPPMTGG